MRNGLAQRADAWVVGWKLSGQHEFPTPPNVFSFHNTGLPFNIVPFPQFELQSKWIARVLSARARLPSAADMWQAGDGVASGS